MADADRNVEPDPTGHDVFDLERIRQLVELMKEHDLGEIDLRQAKQRIRLSRGSTTEPVLVSAPAAPPAAPAAASPSPAPQAEPAAQAQEDESHIAYINSPMVGTFYSKPNPNAESFVKVGDHVEPDKVVCIVEAMKVFNEIPAEVAGRILAVLVEEEEAVDFGRPLFKIDTRN
jgi:acetyl-CoA carboxylase biotin carboxyl carrier protein